MKYAWIEELVDGEEILVDGDELLDGEGNPFDPPQYEQISQVPPVYEQVPSGNGQVTGLNRKAQEGERDGNCANTDLVWGMDVELYKVSLETFTPFTQEEKDAVDAERQAEKDKQDALDAVDQEFVEALAPPVLSEGIEWFAGYESSQMIDSARILADNMNEPTVELWDYYGQPHVLTKQSALQVAIDVGLSFRTNYSAMKHAKKNINDN